MAKRHYIPITADVPGAGESKCAFIRKVIRTALAAEGVDFPCEIDVRLTNDETIHAINREMRQVDRATDVLSFPNIPFETEADFSIVEENCSDYFQPDSGELILGDIILSVDRICSQAESYGHSRKREFAFLVAHSMLHLCGYDHETPEEAAVMEQKQETILSALGLTRDCLDE